MSIRIPQKSDLEVQNAFKDVEERLRDIESAQRTITDLQRKVDDLQSRLDTPSVTPAFTTLGDTVIAGDLRIEGDANIRGEVDAPQILDGIAMATPSETGDSSPAQRVVEVHGSLAVLNAVSAETIRSRNLIVSGTGPYPRVLNSQISSAASSGTGETVAHSYILSGRQLIKNGDRLIIRGRGTATSAANTKTYKVYFGSTSVTMYADGAANTQYRWEAVLTRVSETTQILSTEFATSVGALDASALNSSTPTETLTSSVLIKSTIQMATSGTITETNFSIEYWPAS